MMATRNTSSQQADSWAPIILGAVLGLIFSGLLATGISGWQAYRAALAAQNANGLPSATTFPATALPIQPVGTVYPSNSVAVPANAYPANSPIFPAGNPYAKSSANAYPTPATFNADSQPEPGPALPQAGYQQAGSYSAVVKSQNGPSEPDAGDPEASDPEAGEEAAVPTESSDD